MDNENSIIQTVGAFLSREGAMSAARILIGVVLGAAIGSVSLPWVMGIGAGVVGLTGMAHYSIEKQKKKILLDTYREEISHMVGKPEQQLMVSDLEQVVSKIEQGQGSTALKMALDYFKDTRNFYIGSQVATAALMIGGLSLVNNAFSGVSALGLAGAAGLLYNEMFNAVKSLGFLVFDGNISGTITRDIRAITEQISLGGRVSSTRVLGVLVSANETLSQQVEEKYGHPYEGLSISEKRDLVNQLDPQTHVIQLTRDINAGRVLPTELAFIAFGESSGTPPVEVVPDMHMVSDQENLTKWAAKVPKASGIFAENVTRLDLDENHATESYYTIH